MKHALFSVLILGAGALSLRADDKILAQHPTLSQDRIVFSFAGDLWSVPRQGGNAIHLTASPGNESNPVFSPDGSMIAFSGEYDGNVDVFVIPAAGGVPKRLTYHPGADNVVGWTPDGKNVIFRSDRNSYSRFTRLFTVPLEGGFPTEIDLPMADSGSFSPDASRIAYLPLNPGVRCLEALSRRPHDAHLDRQPGRCENRKDTSRELQRFLPHVDRRQGLLPVRSLSAPSRSVRTT